MKKSDAINYLPLTVLFFIFVAACSSNIQNNMLTPGIYENYGTSILIEGNRLNIRYGIQHSILDGFIIAECEVSHLKNNFYSLHSLDVPLGMFESTTIKYMPGKQADSASLVFNFPNLNWDYFDGLKIIVSEVLSTTEYTHICKSNNYEIKLPRMKKFYVSFAPLEYISYNVLHDYHGLLQFDDYQHVYDTRDQDIIVTMPNVTMDMFYRWYLDDVIIRTDENNIQLFGEKYEKIK